MKEYYNEVYLKNIDIWGFAMSFLVLFNLLCKNEGTLNNTEKKSLRSLCEMFIYILETDASPMDPERISSYVGEVVDNYHE